MPLKRAEVLLRAKSYIRKGVSASKWIADMRAKGLGYRRTQMLADYREVLTIEKKEGLARFVRKGYIPSERTAELRVYGIKGEYLYKVQYESRLRPFVEKYPPFVNIVSDTPMTVEEIEAAVEDMWATQEQYTADELISLRVWSAFRKVR
jgi:hypothetical protein